MENLLNYYGIEILSKYSIPVKRKIDIFISLLSFLILEGLNIAYLIIADLAVGYFIVSILTSTIVIGFISVASGYLMGSITEIRYEYVVKVEDKEVLSKLESHFDIVENVDNIYIIREL